MLCLSHLGLNPSGIDFYVDYEVGIHFIILLSLWASLVAQMVKKIRLQCRRPGFNPWVGKIPWRREWQPTPVFLPGESTWTEEPGGLQSIGSQRVRRGWATKHTHISLSQCHLLKSHFTNSLQCRHKSSMRTYIGLFPGSLFCFIGVFVSGSWWWTGRPGVLQSMGLQRVGHNWATELNWTGVFVSLFTLVVYTSIIRAL